MTNACLLELDAVLSAQGFFDFLVDVDCDSAPDSRDAEPFDAQWMAAFDAIDGDPGTAIDRPAVDALRETVFKLAFGASGKGVAACVSDDLEPIARSRLSGRTDDWPIRMLWGAYKNGWFPCSPLHFCGFPMRGDRVNRDRGATRAVSRGVRARSQANTPSVPPQGPIVKQCESIVSICN
ncbi:hypothetical protein [Burkholderia sp. JP2-270]|uniref:hypothetical protein n=1 Tax=Burkholderia sp. JP2-270 TaxID=2217913 RepID=UPI001EF7F9C6|nr:hypothetical protein [Burkholderia sp. JP2-270]